MAVSPSIPAPLPQLKNILLPTDLSDDSLPVLPFAGQIARTFGARVYVCHIQAEVPLAAGLAAPRLYEAEGKDAAAHLARFRTSSALRGVESKLLLVSGTIHDEMPKLITDNRIDLIMVGTHGRTGLAKVMLGSVAEEICRVATCPVLTAGPATNLPPEAAFRNILFPTNLSEVSKKAIRYIRLLASRFGSRVAILHVAHDAGSANREQQAGSLRRNMAGDFGAALLEFQPKLDVAFGNTPETVLREARQTQAGLIVLGIRNAFRPGILVERTAYRIMAGAHCPVLTVL